MKARHFLSRRYRNRRIGEFLKELDLTEGRGTGIPKIMKAIKKNGSPMPKFETDDNRSYFLTVFPIHPKAKKWGGQGASLGLDATPQVNPQVTPQVDALLKAAHKPLSREELQAVADIKDREHFRKEYLKPLLFDGLLEMTIPDKPNSRLQKYRLTEKGHRWLKSQEKIGGKK